MGRCFDQERNQYVNCPTSVGTYLAIGIIIPIVILILTIIVSAYLRYKRKLLLREQQQQVGATTVVTINNREGATEQLTYQSYPPNYTAAFDNPYDKPPSYEQTVQYLSTGNNISENPGQLPVTPVETSPRVQTLRNQT